MINYYESPLYTTGAIYESQWINSSDTYNYIPQSCWDGGGGGVYWFHPISPSAFPSIPHAMSTL